MLLQRGYGKDDRCVLAQGIHLRPGKVSKFHGVAASTYVSPWRNPSQASPHLNRQALQVACLTERDHVIQCVP